KPGAVLIDHTTTSALLAEELSAAAQQAGLHFMDAPVSGGHAAYIIVITYASEYHIGVLDTFCYRFSILPAKLFRPRHR
ncbi:NAD(P)-binding domain-containing protein, partial [Vibrio cholerae]